MWEEVNGGRCSAEVLVGAQADALAPRARPILPGPLSAGKLDRLNSPVHGSRPASIGLESSPNLRSTLPASRISQPAARSPQPATHPPTRSRVQSSRPFTTARMVIYSFYIFDRHSVSFRSLRSRTSGS